MNLESNPTKAELRRLLASYNDDASHHVLWVDTAGEVHITPLPRVWPPGDFSPAPANLRLRYETFLAGKSYVGQDAADDDEWVDELFRRLSEKWQKVKGTTKAELIRVG